MACGSKKLETPIWGRWYLTEYPEVARVVVNGEFINLEKAHLSASGGKGVVADYRERVRTDALHVKVLADGRFYADHRDRVNPQFGPIEAVEHFFADMEEGCVVKDAAKVVGVVLLIAAVVKAA